MKEFLLYVLLPSVLASCIIYPLLWFYFHIKLKKDKLSENLARKESTGRIFNEIQTLTVEWNKKNFGEHHGSGYRNLLGVAEEVGELCHAQLKGEQGIRHTPEEILKMKKDAVGDIVIFLCSYCDSQNISLEECVETAWQEIKDRDWKRDK